MARATETERKEHLIGRREAAELSGATLRAVDKAIEERLIRVRRGREVLMTTDELAVFGVLDLAELPLPARAKRSIRRWVVGERPHRRRRAGELALSPTLVVRVGPEVRDLVARAERYAAARDRYIEVDPEIKGGEPVIRGTRIGVRAVAARLDAGDSVEELCEDYPDVPRDAFEVARLWARTHPRRGRPVRPWRG
jgi:uncharacterized protein (DUF433 family)